MRLTKLILEAALWCALFGAAGARIVSSEGYLGQDGGEPGPTGVPRASIGRGKAKPVGTTDCGNSVKTEGGQADMGHRRRLRATGKAAPTMEAHARHNRHEFITHPELREERRRSQERRKEKRKR